MSSFTKTILRSTLHKCCLNSQISYELKFCHIRYIRSSLLFWESFTPELIHLVRTDMRMRGVRNVIFLKNFG